MLFFRGEHSQKRKENNCQPANYWQRLDQVSRLPELPLHAFRVSVAR